MRYLDRFLRDRRLAQVARRIPVGAAVLDVGCHDGALFRAIGFGLRVGVGIDSDLLGELRAEAYRLIPGRFPDDLPSDVGPFDVITMLAVFEHVPTAQQGEVVRVCWRLLNDGGRVIVTVPSPAVDPILDVLVATHLIDGMKHEEHFGFDPADLPALFAVAGFRLEHRHRFQLGLNNLFVFVKAA